jgi:hypothetical protein
MMLNYSDKNFSDVAQAMIDRHESFTLKVDGPSAARIYKAANAYQEFYERYVIGIKHRRINILVKFWLQAFLALNFWTMCIYKQGERKNIEFRMHEGALEVFFDFGEKEGRDRR